MGRHIKKYCPEVKEKLNNELKWEVLQHTMNEMQPKQANSFEYVLQCRLQCQSPIKGYLLIFNFNYFNNIELSTNQLVSDVSQSQCL